MVWELEHRKEEGSWVLPGWRGTGLGEGGVIAIFNSLTWTYREGRARFFSEEHTERIRDSRHKFQQGKFQLVWGWGACSIHIGSGQTIDREPWEAGRYPSLEVFRAWLEKAQSELIWLQSWFCFEQGFGPDNLQRSLPTSILLSPHIQGVVGRNHCTNVALLSS